MECLSFSVNGGPAQGTTITPFATPTGIESAKKHEIARESNEIALSRAPGRVVDLGRNPSQPRSTETFEDSTAAALSEAASALLRAGANEEAQRVLEVLNARLGGKAEQREPPRLATVTPIRPR
jgi:hypothetical protein